MFNINIQKNKYDYDLEKYPLWQIPVADILNVIFEYAMCSNVVAATPPNISGEFYKQYKLKVLEKHNIVRILRSLNCFSISLSDKDFCINAARSINSFALSLVNLSFDYNIHIKDPMLFAQEKQIALSQIFKALEERRNAPHEISDLDIDVFIEPIQTIIESDACIVFNEIGNKLGINITPTTPSETLTDYLRHISTSNFTTEMVKVLRLSHKHLMTLPSEISLFTNLESLVVDHNYLQVLPESLFKLNQLAHLELGHNCLSHLSESISNLNQLLQLDCCANRLVELPNGILKLKNLSDISVQDNQLTSLPNGLFSHLPNLSIINLNFNALKQLPDDIHVAKLSFLGFRNNEITSLPHGLRRLGSRDLMIHVRNNPYLDPLSQQDLETLRSLRERGVSFRDMSNGDVYRLLGPKKGWMSADWIKKALGN